MRVFIALFFTFFMLLSVNGQVPDKISYQAIVRTNDGNVLQNAPVGLKIGIIQQSIEGEFIYEESHVPITNENGLISLHIGLGDVSNGDFEQIDWSNGPYYLETQMDLNGGSNYTIIGLTELLSVPYALYAKTAGSISNVNNYLTKAVIVPVVDSRDIQETDIDNTIECTMNATLTLVENFTIMQIGDIINLEAHNGAVLTIEASDGVDLNYQNAGDAIFLSNSGNVRFGILRKVGDNSYIVSGQ